MVNEMREKMRFKRKKRITLDEWYKIAYPIISHPEYQRRKTFRHHGDTSVYNHSINVSIKSYVMAKKLNLDYKSATIAGLLHDFYESPWQDVTIKQPFFKKHGFTHAENALKNSRIYFKKYLNPCIENSIKRHMFPLNIIPPKYKEGLVLTMVDKMVSIDMITSKESIAKTFINFRRS